MNTPVDLLLEGLPTKLRPALAWLGTANWLTYQIGSGNGTKMIRNRIQPPPEFEELHQLLPSLEDMTAMQVDCACKALAHGQKVLRATSEQCLAFEQVDVDLEWKDYSQPYDAIFIELPVEYRQHVYQQHKFPCPRYVLVVKNGTFVITVARNEHSPIVLLNIGSPKYGTIEDGLRQCWVLPGPDMQVLEVISRVAINLCLMMMDLGVKDKGTLATTQRIKKLKKRIAKGDQRAQGELAALPKVMAFAQEVQFYTTDKQTSDSEGGEAGTGAPKKTHWRRGHWRLQRCGKNWGETKRILLKPMMINRARFVGQEQDTMTTYVAH